jgi:hypothetical protein
VRAYRLLGRIVGMSDVDRPSGQAKDDRRRKRRRSNADALVVMLTLLAVALTAVALNAGRWGVPLFGFTNEHGSQCRNQWLGHRCTELTLAHVQHHVRAEFPTGTRLISGSWQQTHDFELTAKVVYPRAVAAEGWSRLTEEYGECRHRVPSPLDAEPDLSGVCVMTNIGGFGTGMAQDAEVWRITTATQPDGDTVVDLLIRSR